MFDTIFKYVLAMQDEQLMQMPVGAKVLHVDLQHEEVCIWARVDSKAELESRKFYIRGTGHFTELPQDAKFLGTVLMRAGMLIFHVFEENA